MLIDKVTENMDDITKAIQISMEEMTLRGETTERLKGYVDMLNQKGINEISILSDTSEVIASSNPQKIGTQAKIGKKKDFLITAKMGETSTDGPQRLYNVILPVLVQGQNVGYIHISMVLDDYRLIQRKNHLKRILSTIFAFTIGIIICLILAEKYTEPIKKMANAARRIAHGELVEIPQSARKDEIGVLEESFNEMVEKLKERKALEDKLKRSEQLSIIGQLSSGVAHEIRNPLNFLLLSIGHVKERIAGSSMDEKKALVELLDDSSREIHRMNELIHNFLLLGRPVTLRKEPVEIRTLIEEALYIVKDKVRPAVRIVLECDNTGGSIICDREYMRICLLNLILNAIQAIDADGVVTVGCTMDENTAVVTVTDTGTGIAEDDLARVFEPYYSTKTSGFGLGLSITKRFVEEHGGTIKAESIPNHGTTMRIEVPRNEV